MKAPTGDKLRVVSDDKGGAVPARGGGEDQAQQYSASQREPSLMSLAALACPALYARRRPQCVLTLCFRMVGPTGWSDLRLTALLLAPVLPPQPYAIRRNCQSCPSLRSKTRASDTCALSKVCRCAIALRRPLCLCKPSL